MGGGNLGNAKIVAIGSSPVLVGGDEGKGFFSLDGSSFTQIVEPSFDNAPYPYYGIGYNTTTDISQPKWAVVANPFNQGKDTSYTGFYSSNGIDWDAFQDVSFFWNDVSNNGYNWNSIASDGSKNWVAVGTNPSDFRAIGVTTSSIDTSNSWSSFDLADNTTNPFNTYYAVDYHNNYWICVGQRSDDLTSDNALGGVWTSPTINQAEGWDYINDTSNVNYEYKGVAHDLSGRWMIVGHKTDTTFGKAYYSQQSVDPNSSTWNSIDSSVVDVFNTTWNDTDYSPVHDRWVIVGNDNNFPSKGKIVYNLNGNLSIWNVADISSDPDLSGFLSASSVVWDNNFNKFFAAGSITNSSFTTNGVILESSDGIVWQKSGSIYDDISGLGFLGIASSSPNL